MVSDQGGKAKVKILETEWQAYYQTLDDWLDYINKSSKTIGWPLKEQSETSNYFDLDSEFDVPKM